MTPEITPAPILGTGDIFTKKFLEGFSLSSLNIDINVLLLTLGIALGCGLFIFYVYKRTFKGVMYSASFNLSLIMLCMVTSLIIVVISNHIGLSLGMVGALSIVRFRTAVKEPMDTSYMFWAIATGITLGAGYYLFSVIGVLAIGIVMFVLHLLPMGRGGRHFLLVLHYDATAQTDVGHLLARVSRTKVKSRAVTPGGVELTVELRLPNDRTNLADEFLKIRGVYDATLVSYQSEML